MPVQAQTRVNRSTGNGVTTVFPYSFRVLSKNHIRVTVDGTVKTVDTDYTVSGVGDAGGGNVTFTTAPASATAVVLSGSAPYSRSTDYVRNGSFQEETVDADFDLAVILIQQLDERLSRAISIPIDDSTGTAVELPAAAARASLYLAFDSEGNPVAVAGTTSEVPITPFAATMLDDVDAAAVRATLGLHNKFVQRVAAAPVTAVTSSNVQIPLDDTIPQITEGVEVFTVAITPDDATDILRIEADFSVVACAGATTTVIALFKNNDANAIAVTVVPTLSGVTYPYPARLVHDIVAGGTDEITFKVRFGPAGATTSYLNANGAGTRFFGGVASAKLQVSEYEP